MFFSNTVSKLLDTVRIVSVSSLHIFPDFLLWQPSSIIILLTSHSLKTPLHSGPKWTELVSQFPADFIIPAAIVNTIKPRRHLWAVQVQLLGNYISDLQLQVNDELTDNLDIIVNYLNRVFIGSVEELTKHFKCSHIPHIPVDASQPIFSIEEITVCITWGNKNNFMPKNLKGKRCIWTF